MNIQNGPWEGAFFDVFHNGSLVIQKKEMSCEGKKKNNLRHVLEIESISIALEIGYGSKKIEFAPSGQII